MKLALTLHALLLITFLGQAQTREVCFTIDDLTVVPYTDRSEKNQTYITESIVNTCIEYRIPAIGFVNEKKLYPNGVLDSLQLGFLEYWLKNELELGNHGHSHLDYHNTNLNKYQKDLIEGEKHSKPLSEAYGKDFKYFRHPFLHIGTSKEKHDSLRVFLSKVGYEEAPVTIDNSDYLFALAYHRTLSSNNGKLAAKIGDDYITYMENVLHYYEGLSNKLLGRNMKHILLMHASRLNADYLVQLAKMYKNNGYSFISIEDALTDPAHQLPITKYGPYGISWIDRWAISEGRKEVFFAGYVEVPEYINSLAK